MTTPLRQVLRATRRRTLLPSGLPSHRLLGHPNLLGSSPSHHLGRWCPRKRPCQEVCKRAQAAAFSSAVGWLGFTRTPFTCVTPSATSASSSGASSRRKVWCPPSPPRRGVPVSGWRRQGRKAQVQAHVSATSLPCRGSRSLYTERTGERSHRFHGNSDLHAPGRSPRLPSLAHRVVAALSWQAAGGARKRFWTGFPLRQYTLANSWRTRRPSHG
jgi:hypothetical protein